jgi:protoheme IX farnesyltransferase
MIAGLLRIRLCGAVTATALAGLLLCPAAPWTAALPLSCGAFLLALCGTLLNQVQERHSDARMLRTRQRPLPAGRVQPRTVLAAAVVTAASGLTLLASCNWRSAAAGAAALFCYNGLYTPLKRHTALALLPGALCGSLAPCLGWLAGGGRMDDHRMLLLGGLLLLWQLPHFWLFAMRHHTDLQRAGLFPDLVLQPNGSLWGLIFLWTFALSVATLLLPTLDMLPEWVAVPLCLTVWIGPLKSWRSLRPSLARSASSTSATPSNL